jgi:hypothetical protein
MVVGLGERLMRALRPPYRDPEERRAHLAIVAMQFNDIVARFIERLYEEYVIPSARWWEGNATDIDTVRKTVSVTLDPFPGDSASHSVKAAYGRPKWTRAQIVGKRVRVMIDMGKVRDYTIDDVVNNA